jgi:hypothetical protein
MLVVLSGFLAYVRSTVRLHEDRLQSLRQSAQPHAPEAIIRNSTSRVIASLPMEDIVERMRRDVTVEVVRATRSASAGATGEDGAARRRAARPSSVMPTCAARGAGRVTIEFLRSELDEARRRLAEQGKLADYSAATQASSYRTAIESGSSTARRCRRRRCPIAQRDRDRRLLLNARSPTWQQLRW